MPRQHIDTAADMPSAPMTRDAALHRVRVLLQDIPYECRDTLFAAIVDYGHASATEVLNQCQAAVREVLTP